MLVYGPSARGALRALAQRLGAQTLNDLLKPPDIGWAEFSLQTLDAAADSEAPILFDLTHVEDVAGVLAGVGDYAQTVTSVELRYIRDNWDRFAAHVQFYRNEARQSPPWQQP